MTHPLHSQDAQPVGQPDPFQRRCAPPPRAGYIQRWAERIGALMLKTLLAITMMVFTPICLADTVCENLAKKVLEYKGDTSPHSWIGSICKSKPDDVRKSFLVMDQRIYLIDINSGQILSQGELGDVSFNIESIDTGRYWLTPKVRAFGIRSSEYRPHYHAGEHLYSLNLYVIEGKTIRPVMEKLDIGYSASGEDCNEQNECEQFQTHQQATVAIAKTRHNGFADLIVAGKVLVYDGTRYVVPDDLLQQ